MAKRWMVRAAAALALTVPVFAGPVTTWAGEPPASNDPSGDGVEPELFSGNPTCGQLVPGSIEFKIEPVVDGVYTDGFLTVTIDVRDTDDGQVFDWTSNIGVDAVFAKGANQGNLFVYDPPAEDNGDTGLHAPVNESGDYAGLSHISFCYDVRASVDVDKTGDDLGKATDPVTYTFTITNNGDVPITFVSISDTLIAGLDPPDSCDSLAVGASCNFTADRTVVDDDPDPLVNTVTVTYEGTLPDDSVSEATSSDSHETNLFQPSISVAKTADATLSTVGETVNYTVTMTNSSSDDTPAMNCTAVDTLGGTLHDGVLPLGDTVVGYAHVVAADDPDPLVNTVTLTCSPDGFPNVFTASASHTVELFQPAVAVDKTGDALSKIGDPVDYTVTLSNNSSADTPEITCVATDTLQGELHNGVLPSGATVINYTRNVADSDPDPVVNTVTMNCTIAGFATALSASDGHETNLFQPSVAIDKGGPSEGEIGETVTYTFTITNTSSADAPNLDLASISDTVLGDLSGAAGAAGCGSLAAGASCNFTVSYTIPGGSPDPIVNTVSVLYHPTGFPNDITASDSHTLDIVVRFDGCTPGFWKTHTGQWGATGYSTGQTVESVFDVPDAYGLDSKTLLQALSFQGNNTVAGGAQILLRAGVAALLNSAHPGVDYPMSTGDVIGAVNAALASGDRATMIAVAGQLDANNNLGCTLS